VQDEIVQKMVTTLKLQLTLWEQGVLVRKTTDNLEAYDSVLRGLETGVLRERLTPETIAQARQMWEKALELDPQYSEAYALLSFTYFIEWFYALRQDPQALDQAFALAQKAVSLDDFLPLAHGTLGVVYLMQKQYEQALTEAQRAVALNPNEADRYVGLGLILAYIGRPEEAIEVWQKAMRLNPHYPTSYSNALGWGYLLTRRYDEGIAVLKNAISRNPNYPPLRATLAIIYSELGRDEEARAEGAIILKQLPTFSLEVFAQRIPYKDPEALERHIAGLRKAGLK
jgi:adenylate cyclase